MKKYFLVSAFTALLTTLLVSGITVFASGPGDSFPDVDQDKYYADAVQHMRMMGVISGHDDGNYRPKDYVNRADVAVMFDRYDDALILEPGNTWNTPSGIQDLVTIICSDVISYDAAADYVLDTKDRICPLSASPSTCTTEDCFNNKFESCEETSFSSDVGIAAVEYDILGPNGGDCELSMVYTENINPEWVDQPMTCVLDNDLEFTAALEDQFNAAILGEGTCTGPLADILSQL